MLEKGQTLAHYTILEKLGEGGMGTVYKALDTKLERVVALKTLLPGQIAGLQQERRFMQEAKSASALNHPNIITIHEIGCFETQHYIAMEFIQGRTLRSLIHESPGIPALIPIMRQMAEAMSAAHAHGIVHRDIKPDNVMVRSDGYVKVLDFGVARLTRASDEEDLTRTGITSPGAVLGTAKYMSPEQFMGEPFDVSSDIFAMGLVFFELITGKHPFHAGTRQGYMIGIVTKSATHPSKLNPECPPALDSLILQMLSKDKLLRPGAEAVKATLAGLGQGGAATVPATRLVNRHLVGRERELNELRESFAPASAGCGAFVCVSGEAGMGKTTVVEEFLAELESQIGVCWIGRGHCSERLGEADAYVAVLECLDSLLRGQAGDHAGRLMRLHAPTWYLLVAPSLGDATQEALIKDAKTGSHERMRREFLAFFEELARLRPVVLFFDDVHWSDASSCDLLAYLAARIRAVRVLLIASYRPAQLQASKHPFLTVKVTLEARGQCRELPLSNLGPKDIDLYVSKHFPKHLFPRELIQVIHEKTEGNALFMTDMLRYLRDRRVVAEEQGHWVLTQPVADVRKEIPASIRSLVQLKIDQFDDADRRLLLAGAVQGMQFDSAVLAKVLERDPVEVEERLQTLETMHRFVTAISEQEFSDHSFSVRYGFVHVFYQNALYASLTPSRRAALSRSIARAVVALYGEDKLRAMAADVALLFEAARDYAHAVTYFRVAARNAARVFAYQEAAILCERGMRALLTLPESVERDREELMFSLTLGISLMATRGYAAHEVEQTHLRSRELCLKLNETQRLFPVLWGLHTCYILNANVRSALELAREMKAIAEAGQDRIAIVESRHAMASTLSAMGRIVEARQELDDLFATHPVSSHVLHASLYVMDPYVTCLSTLARLQFFLGYADQALKTAQESVALANRLAHAPSVAYASFWVGWVYFSRGEYDTACLHLDNAVALSREHRLPQTLEWTRVVRGAARARMGYLEEGIAEMRESLSNLKSIRSELDRGYCLTLLAEALMDSGADLESLQVVEEALKIAQRTEERYYEPEMYRLRGELLHEKLDVLRALKLARERECRSMELRAAGTLLQITGSGRQEFAELLDWFTEGRDTPEFLAAQRILTSPPI